MFDQFHRFVSLSRSFASYFVNLIPKIKSLVQISDFKSTFLVGCLYKLVAKVFATRLDKAMDKLVSHNQSTLIKGWMLVDGVVFVNELIYLAKKYRKPLLIFNVDFEKAYDSVSWEFLDYMLGRFGFNDKWRYWIRICVFVGNLTMLVNGCTTQDIIIQKGLKQRDPLAHFLFLLVAMGLSGLIMKVVEYGLFFFRIRASDLVVSHLQYAYYTIILEDTYVDNIWIIKAILRGL